MDRKHFICFAPFIIIIIICNNFIFAVHLKVMSLMSGQSKYFFPSWLKDLEKWRLDIDENL